MKFFGSIIILSWLIYIPCYFLFFDSAEETVENVTLEDLWYLYSMSPNEPELLEQQLNTIEDQDVQIDESLKSVLKDWKVENLKVSSQDMGPPGLKEVFYSFTKGPYKITYHANAIEKNMIRMGDTGPFAKFIMIDAIKCEYGKNHRILTHEDDLKMFLISTFAKPKTNGLSEAIQHFCPKTGVEGAANETIVEESEVSEVTDETSEEYTSVDNSEPAIEQVYSSESIYTPTFDCEKASNTAENWICSDNDLAYLDIKLNDLYQSITNTESVEMTELKQSQKLWLKERNRCDDKSCIQIAYMSRIKNLEALL